MDYGNPSGHTYNCAFFYLLILWVYDRKFHVIYEEAGLNYKRIAFILLYIITIVIVAFTRVYLGVHSLNQVILGIIYGIGFMIIYTQFLSNYVQQNLTIFVQKEKT